MIYSIFTLMSGEVKMIIDSTYMILSINKEIPPAELTVWGGFESFAPKTVSLKKIVAH